MQVTVKEVQGKKELKAFYQFQNKLYKGCGQYVPSLDADQKSTLTEDPALEYCTRKMWLAYKGDRIVGRIQAIVNPRYNEFYSLKRVRFGWFDFEEDIEIARALLDTAKVWGREQGMTQIHGPLFYNTLGKQGMLVEGFENTPPYNCIYNYPYYPEYMEKLGFEKELDWIQYKLNGSQGAPEKLQRLSDILMRKYNLRLLDLKEVKGEFKKELIGKFFKVYNECFQSVPNFIPFTQKEIEKTGKAYFSLLRPELTCIVVDGNNDIAAFGLCFPSLSQALKKANGSLFPFGWYHILKAYLKYDTVDLMLVGSSPAWAQKGLSAIFHNRLAENSKERNVKCCITNPQADTNIAAVKVWENYDKEPFMRRRCWIGEL